MKTIAIATAVACGFLAACSAANAGTIENATTGTEIRTGSPVEVKDRTVGVKLVREFPNGTGPANAPDEVPPEREVK